MRVCARLLLLAALPALVGRAWWCVEGEVVSVTEVGGSGGGGVGPAFAPRQHTSVVAAVGQTATLECRILRLGDKSVSWVRSRDLQILTHAGAVFTADARVAAGGGVGGGGGSPVAAGGRHTLLIERLRTSDSGRYECQVNTEPKLSLFFNLTVIDEPVPVVVVEAVGPRRVRASAGGAGSLACEARYEPAPHALPAPPLDVRWMKDHRLINLQGPRGGVSLDTERWAARVVSRLTLAELRAGDAGAYTCVAAPAGGAEGGGPGSGARATLHLVVLDADAERQLDAMQRDETAVAQVGAAPPSDPRPRFLAAALSILLLLMTHPLHT